MEFQCLWHVVITWQRSHAEYFKMKSVSLHVTSRKCVNKMLSAPCLLTSCTDFRLLWAVACPSKQQMSFLALLVAQLGWLVAFLKGRKEILIVTEAWDLALTEMSSWSFFLMYLATSRRKPWRLSCFARWISDSGGVSWAARMAHRGLLPSALGKETRA